MKRISKASTDGYVGGSEGDAYARENCPDAYTAYGDNSLNHSQHDWRICEYTDEQDVLECASTACVYNVDSECRYSRVFDRDPEITDNDGCISGVVAPTKG